MILQADWKAVYILLNRSIKDEMKTTTQAIEKVHGICQKEDKGGTELLAELDAIFKHIRYVLMGCGFLS